MTLGRQLSLERRRAGAGALYQKGRVRLRSPAEPFGRGGLGITVDDDGGREREREIHRQRRLSAAALLGKYRNPHLVYL